MYCFAEIRAWGYKSGTSLRGAPYDFRYGAPSQPHDYHSRLKALVEETYAANHGNKVTLLTHSMGGLLAHSFLVTQTQEWKDRHIKELISLSTPWKGTVTMMHAILSGYTWGHSIGIDHLTIRRVQRNSQSGYFLLPSPSLWGPSETLVQTTHKNYTAHQYKQIMEDIGYPQGVQMWEGVKDLIMDLPHPGVSVFCLHSYGVHTAQTLVYKEGEFPDFQPTVLHGDGDGTVNLRSLQACREWSNSPATQKHPVVHKVFHRVTHNGMLHDRAVLEYLREVITRDWDKIDFREILTRPMMIKL